MNQSYKVPSQVEDFVVNDDEEAPSLLNPLTGQILILNQTGKRIFDLADGIRTIEEIAAIISKEFRGAQETLALQHTQRFLDVATQKGIVRWINQD